MNGKTRDFCDARAILNEKTRHSHKAAIRKDCKNACKRHLIFRKPCKNAYKKIRRALKFRVRSKAEGLQHKENPGPEPLPGKIIQKTPPRSQIQGAVKAEGLPDKENPGPVPLPGKTQRSHKRLSENIGKLL